MTTPREIIESIRRKKFGIGLDTDAAAKSVFREQQGMLSRALSLIAEDLYSKDDHFVLELIQNADDNDYQDSVTPLLTFKIDNENNTSDIILAIWS